MDDNLFTPSDFFHRGMEFLDEGQFNQALEHFQQAVDREYIDPDILGPMGEALFELGRVSEALDYFNRAVKNSDDADKALLWKGICYLELQKHRRALSAFNRLIDKDPENAQAHFKRGLALIEIGSPSRALEALETAHNLLKNNPSEFQEDALSDVLLWKGRAKMALNQRPEALELLHEALELVPDHPGVYSELGQYFRTIGDMKTAEDWYRKGLDRLPDDPNLHNDFGNMLRETGNYQASLEHLTAAIENGATRSVVYYNRALSLRSLGRYDEALKDFEVVVESNPGDIDARLSKLDLLGKLNLFVDAEELIDDLRGESIPRDMFNEYLAEYYSYKAKWCEAKQDANGMLEAYAHVLGIHPDFLDIESPGKDGSTTEQRLENICELLADLDSAHEHKHLAHLLEGACYFTLARFAAVLNVDHEGTELKNKARNALVAALQGDKYLATAHKLLAEVVYYEFNEPEKALEHADKALQEIPDYVNAFWVKAMIYGGIHNQPEKAIECYRRMLEISPHNVSVMFSMAELYFDHGQPQRALYYYQKAVSERPVDPSIQRDIGFCYLALERYGDAIQIFSRLLEADDSRLDIRLDLAESYLAVGDRAEVETLLTELESMNEGVDEHLDNRVTELRAALCNRRNNPEGALRVLADVQVDELSPFGIIEYCKALIKLKKYKQAELFLNAVVEDSGHDYPMAVEARYQLARILFAKDDIEGALLMLEEMLDAAPLDERAYRLKAWCLMLEGELELSEACSEAGKYAQQVSKIVRLLQYEDYREALTNAEALIEDSPGRAESQYYKACAHTQLVQTDEALETIRDLLKTTPEILPRLHSEFYLEPLRLQDRIEFRLDVEE
ncbi:MAG: tetratricopeptide repeat protein [Planctomycetes bacterium]|nr:tetratricopeptide repeat protein [Planctomycetota bacterium]